jgi:hypothetical protein
MDGAEGPEQEEETAVMIKLTWGAMTEFGRIAVVAFLCISSLSLAAAIADGADVDWIKTVAVVLLVLFGLVAVVTFLVMSVRLIVASHGMAKQALRESNMARGICPVCGYDVRANDDRCSECGEPIQTRLATDAQTPAIRRVIRAALADARRGGADHLGSQHLLLALLRDEDSVAAAALEELGVSEEDLRDVVAELLGPRRVESIDAPAAG